MAHGCCRSAENERWIRPVKAALGDDNRHGVGINARVNLGAVHICSVTHDKKKPSFVRRLGFLSIYKLGLLRKSNILYKMEPETGGNLSK
jgi:hypothetical protein